MIRALKIQGVLFALIVNILFFSGQCFASGFVSVGSEWAQSGGVAKVEEGDRVVVQLEAGRSYACTAIGQGFGSHVGLSTTVEDTSSQDLTATACGDVSPPVTVTSTELSQADNRIAIMPKKTGDHLIKVAHAYQGGETIRFECVETTLFGVWNTNVNDFNFLELTNITNKEITVKWTAIDFEGESFTDELKVPSNRRVDVDLHSLVGNNKFGHLVVQHNGPRGAIMGSVSQYSGTVSNFNLSLSVVLRERTQTL